VPLQDLWSRDGVERLIASLSPLQIRRCLATLKDDLVTRIRRSTGVEPAWHEAPRIIQVRAGRVSIADMAGSHGLSRQQFAARFGAAAGLPPKLFARITRFHSLVHALLSTEVSRWASVSSDVGFYDQAHMINEFRTTHLRNLFLLSRCDRIHMLNAEHAKPAAKKETQTISQHCDPKRRLITKKSRRT
jgi:AraC-like DNA-binding protein